MTKFWTYNKSWGITSKVGIKILMRGTNNKSLNEGTNNGTNWTHTQLVRERVPLE